jgi:hemolysin III
MTKKEIKSNYKKEKKSALMEYKTAIREADAKYRALIDEAEDKYQDRLIDAEYKYDSLLEEFYLVQGKKPPINPPKRPILEEIGNSITHGLGAVFAIVAFILMLLKSDTAVEYVSASIYFSGLFILFMSSCLYHAFAYGSKVKRLFHRFDYCSIYLLIGATFAPVLLCHFGDLFGYIFFGIQWAIIATGVTFVGIFGPKRLSFMHIPLYVILGWSALMLLPDLFSNNFDLGLWILIGGVVYTVGIIPFLLRTRVSHFIWHFFVLAGAVIHWIGIYLYLFN